MPNPWDSLPDAPTAKAAPWADLPDAPTGPAPDWIERTRQAIEAAAPPPDPIPATGQRQLARRPSDLASSGTREAEDSAAARYASSPINPRTAIETGVGVATIPFGGELIPLARMALAGLAGAAGSIASEPFDPTPAFPAGRQPLLGPPLKEPSRLASAGQRAVETGLGMAAGEGAGSLLSGGLGMAERGILRGPANPVRDMAVREIEAKGGVIPPAQATGSNLARLLQGVGESSIFAAPGLQAARTNAREIATKAVQDFAEQLPLRHSREELGKVVSDAIHGHRDAFLNAAANAYGRVDQAFDAAVQQRLRDSGAILPAGEKYAAEPIVDLGPARAEAEKALNEAGQGLHKAEAESILRQVMGKPDKMTFEAAARLRSDLLAVKRGSTEMISGAASQAAKRVVKYLDGSMEASAKAAGPEVYDAWRAANEGYKRGATLFNSDLIRQLASRNPEAVVDGILQANRPGSVRLAKQAIGKPQLWQGVQREYVERLLTRDAVDPGVGNLLSGQRLLTKLRQFGDSGKELLGAQNHAELTKLAQVLQVAQEFTGKGAGGVSVRAGPEGAALYLAGSGRYGAAATTALAPHVIGQLFTNPTAVRLLTRGFQAPAGSKAALRIFAQLSQIATHTAVDSGRWEDAPGGYRTQNGSTTNSATQSSLPPQ